MTTSPDDECKVCGAGPLAHRGLNHRFSADGQLLPVEEPKRPQVASGIDLALRLVLIDAGILSAEDIALKEAELRERIQARRDASDSP